MLKNFTNILIIVLLLIGCDTLQKTFPINDKPNILIIYPDQLRRYSAGFWSDSTYSSFTIGKPDPVLTPNIDKLAKNGMVFTQAISNFPLCSPARGMLLSGMYPEQNGIWNNCRINRDDSLKDDIPTMTDLFFEAGYNTAYFGKCHWLKNSPLFDENGNYIGSTNPPGGHYLNDYDTYVPTGKSRHHIEYFYQAVKDQHYDPLVFSNDPNAINGKKDGELYRPKEFSPKNESEKIIQYLKNATRERDGNKPFFIIWSINPPHNPWDEANTDMEMYREYYDEKKIPRLDSLITRDNADLEIADYARNYFANVTSIDKYIGTVLDQMEKMGVLENTIVILSSDHGEMLASHGKEGKNTFETEALSVPFVIHWPKRLKSGVSDVLLSVPDVLPTTMSLAGLKQNIPITVQGIDFSNIILGKNTEDLKEPEGALIMLKNARGVQTKHYTLCLIENTKLETAKEVKELSEIYMYDNIGDPYQFKKIPIEDRPEVAQKLLKILGKELKRTNDPWFKAQKYRDVIIYPSS